MNVQKLIETAKILVADNKGLLAMDESNPTCNKRFAKLDIPQTKEYRRAYRELIITTRWLAMLPCARKLDWFLLLSRKC